MDVVFLQPSYPLEMPEYTRGLAEVGARVYGVGDTAPEALPAKARAALHDYLRVPKLMDEADLVQRVAAWMKGRNVDRVESVWEPLVLAAARLRERLGVPGMSYDTVVGFRDKDVMKSRVAAAGLRVPKAFRVRTTSETRAAAEQIGFPLILKPIAGAGSADTYRVRDQAELERVLGLMRHVTDASCEEFVEGDEFTYDTICVNGRPLYENCAQYLPRPLDARSHEWISPVIITVRHLEQSPVREGMAFGRKVMTALGMGTGFTHMEWYYTPKGEIVFGEIGCRAGGARLVDQMNYTSDVDLFREWARAVCWNTVELPGPRLYNCAIIFKRAMGQGHITRIEGLREFMARNHRWLCVEDLLPVGSHRRDWKQTLVSDGFLIVRHPDWSEARRIADEAASMIRMYAS